MVFYPNGAIYPRFGYAQRNEPVELPEANPLPENAKIADCGNAGEDGYTVLTRASRYTGERSLAGPATPQYEGPRMSEDY